MTRKVVETVELKDGMYFTATYKGKKIRGIVDNSWNGLYKSVELNNKGYGNINGDDDEYIKFSHTIYINASKVDESWDVVLKDAGVANFVECKDKRQKAIIDLDKLLKFGGHVVKKIGGKLVFGCGAVELTPNQIKRYLKIRKAIGCSDLNSICGELEVYNNNEFIHLGDNFFEAVQKAINARDILKSATKADREAFFYVIKEINDADDSAITINNIDEYTDDEILELLEYFK